MNLADLKPVARTFEIMKPGKVKKPIGIRVTAVSIEDDKLKRLKRQIANERQRLDARGKYFKADELEANQDEMLFQTITGWEWYGQEEIKDADGKVIQEAIELPDYNGSQLTFNRANFNTMIAHSWFKDQLMIEVTETEDFFLG